MEKESLPHWALPVISTLSCKAQEGQFYPKENPLVEYQPAGRMCCYLKIKEEVDIGEKLFKFVESTWVHLTDETQEILFE